MSQVTCRILVVDDDRENREQYASLVLGGAPGANVRSAPPILPLVATASSAESAMLALEAARDRSDPFHVLVTDLFMPGPADGVRLIMGLRDRGFIPEDLDVVLLSRQEDAALHQEEIEEAALVFGDGNAAAVTQVFRESEAESIAHVDEFLTAVWKGIWQRIDDHLFRQVTEHLPAPEEIDVPGFASSDGEFFFCTHNVQLRHRLSELFAKAAPTDVSILIQGETGTGKEIIARLIHERSERRKGPFVAFNCAAIPKDLFESEMFGHVRGAFTGATGEKRGLFTLAHGGTLFLDEVGELLPEHQGKLLRVLGRRGVRTFSPVGSLRTETADVRIISASNRDLDHASKVGEFREDLFARLEGIPAFWLPSLRERAEDIPVIALRFWRQYSEGVAGRTEAWTDGALAGLKELSWPRNVRSIQSIITLLKIYHPAGEVVTTGALEALQRERDVESPFLYPRQLTKYHQRSQHVVFLTALRAVLDPDSRGRVTEFLERVVKDHGLLFWHGDDPETQLKKVQQGWQEHKRVCDLCRKFAASALT